jgi:hypothetical protein
MPVVSDPTARRSGATARVMAASPPGPVPQVLGDLWRGPGLAGWENDAQKILGGRIDHAQQ